MNKYKIKFQPYDKTFEIEEGRDILSFAIENGINIPSICNGEKLCGKCIVKILEGNCPPTHIETKFFSDLEIKDGLRLACKTKVRDKVKVIIGGAPVSQAYADEIGADGYSPDAASAVEKAKELLNIA